MAQVSDTANAPKQYGNRQIAGFRPPANGSKAKLPHPNQYPGVFGRTQRPWVQAFRIMTSRAGLFGPSLGLTLRFAAGSAIDRSRRSIVRPIPGPHPPLRCGLRDRSLPAIYCSALLCCAFLLRTKVRPGLSLSGRSRDHVQPPAERFLLAPGPHPPLRCGRHRRCSDGSLFVSSLRLTPPDCRGLPPPGGSSKTFPTPLSRRSIRTFICLLSQVRIRQPMRYRH